MILADFIFVVLHWKIHPTVYLNKYFKKLDVIVVKKKSF